MISVRIQKVTKRFGGLAALREINLEIAPGELFFILGPSGCGKTTLLRSLAGFHIPDEGRIWLGEADVTHLPPHKRNIGMMFQSFALWPHLTVAQNVAFGLEERRLPKSEIRRRVGETLESVRMGEFADRRPVQLSGGQQQRIALARALVIRPSCLLLDEPLSNLDAKLRLEMRSEIRRVCREFRLTTIYVTHDQKEALSIADRMAILEAGSISQVGSPLETYRRPVRRSVAQFLGETNLVDGTLVSAGGGQAIADTPLGRFEGLLGDIRSRPIPGSPVTVAIRPESFRLGQVPESVNSIGGRIGESLYLGEIAQHEFISRSIALKIVELNPRSNNATLQMNWHATVAIEDVVILTE